MSKEGAGVDYYRGSRGDYRVSRSGLLKAE